jgi:CspA family cold shock protein
MTESTETQRFTGRVKWFNRRAGYGFIVQSSGDDTGEEVFVHHTSIHVSSKQYKYLVDGEYVTFSIVPMTDVSGNEGKTQAGEVRGVDDGVLMCETQNATRTNRPKKPRQTTSTRGRGSRRGKGRGQGQRYSTRPQQRKRISTTVTEEDGVMTVRPTKSE